MIEIHNLSMYYQKKRVLNNINVNIEKGITGVLGPNGAGKTTLFRCMIGTLKYEGSICMEQEGKVGYLPQDFDCFHELQVGEAMEYLALLKNADVGETDALLEKVELLSEKKKKIKKLSGGMKRRLGIAQSMIGNPKIILMDEPTAGLDPESRLQVRNIISEIGSEVAVMVSSHIASDLDAVAEHIIFLNQGSIKHYGSKEQILKELQGKVREITVGRNEYKDIKQNYTSVRWEGDRVTLRLVGDTAEFKTGKIVAPVLEDAYFYYEGLRSV